MRCEGDVANMIDRHVKVDAMGVLLGCHDPARGVEDEYVETIRLGRDLECDLSRLGPVA